VTKWSILALIEQRLARYHDPWLERVYEDVIRYEIDVAIERCLASPR
jgi:hypothetical protein